MAQQTNEALKDYLSLIAKALDPVARAHKLGSREINNIVKQAVSKFNQYMGRNRQNWNNVTWNTLYKFLTIPNIFNLSNEDINKIVLDQDIKNKISTTFRNLPSNYMANIYAKPSEPISGDSSANNAADIAQAIATMILELVSINHLDKESGGREVPDPTAPNGATQSGQSSASSRPVQATPLTKPTLQSSTDPVLDALFKAKHRIENALYTLQGGAP